MLYDIAETTQRIRTPEGFLRAPAIVTRAGDFAYDAASIGRGPTGKRVIVERTLDTISHPDTLQSLRGAPVTIGHPPEGVSASNYQKLAVGSIVGEPTLGSDGTLSADVLIGDQSAIDALESGKSQLSIGYEFGMVESGHSRYRTKGGMRINHVALVEQGRAGPKVRVADESESLEDSMKAEDISAAVVEGLKQAGMVKATDAADTQSVQAVVTASLQPLVTAVDGLTTAQAAAQDEAKRAEATRKAEAAAAKLVKDTKDEMTAHFNVCQDVAAFIPEAERATIVTKSTDEVLKMAAVGAGIANAEQYNSDTLRGMLIMARAQGQDSVPAAPGAAPSLPQGVQPVGGRMAIEDPRSQAYNDFVKDSAEAYMGETS